MPVCLLCEKDFPPSGAILTSAGCRTFGVCPVCRENAKLGAAMSESKTVCCEEFETYLKRAPNFDMLKVGTGEISGSIHTKDDGIFITDGWHDYLKIDFNYCPFCGEKK